MSNPEAVEVVVLAGDGVGPEVLGAARKVLDVALAREEAEVAWVEFPCGGKHWSETGEEWPAEAFERCRSADAVLLGAVGYPGAIKPDGELAGGGVLFGLRLGLDLYANVRPCRLYRGVPHRIHDGFRTVWDPDQVDLVLVRENTEGAYVPIKGTLSRGGADEVAVDSRVITRKGATRVITRAFEIATRRKASGRGPGRVTCVDKSNVLAGCRLFRACFQEVAADFPDIETRTMYIDAFCHALVRQPEEHDVVVLPNLQGDIATDLAAALQGGMGMAASGNLGDEHGMFEPVHGSAPDLAGTGRANPLAAVLSGSMLLEYVGERRDRPALRKAAAAVEAAVQALLISGEVMPADLGGQASCAEVTDDLLRLLEGQRERPAA